MAVNCLWCECILMDYDDIWSSLALVIIQVFLPFQDLQKVARLAVKGKTGNKSGEVTKGEQWLTWCYSSVARVMVHYCGSCQIRCIDITLYDLFVWLIHTGQNLCDFINLSPYKVCTWYCCDTVCLCVRYCCVQTVYVLNMTLLQL